MGHESRIEAWSPHKIAFCFAGFRTDRLRREEVMKTGGRENSNRWANASSNRAHGAEVQNRSCSIMWAGKQEKVRPLQECFFLTFPFIEPGLSRLTRNNSALRAYSRLRVFGRKVLYDPQGGTISRKEFYEQKTRFCVCCIDGSSRCSARAGETTCVVRSTGAVRSAREPDYRQRKRFLLVCK